VIPIIPDVCQSRCPRRVHEVTPRGDTRLRACGASARRPGPQRFGGQAHHVSGPSVGRLPIRPSSAQQVAEKASNLNLEPRTRNEEQRDLAGFRQVLGSSFLVLRSGRVFQRPAKGGSHTRVLKPLPGLAPRRSDGNAAPAADATVFMKWATKLPWEYRETRRGLYTGVHIHDAHSTGPEDVARFGSSRPGGVRG
jgi:hypothetical protein